MSGLNPSTNPRDLAAPPPEMDRSVAFSVDAPALRPATHDKEVSFTIPVPQSALEFRTALPHEQKLTPDQVAAAYPANYFASRSRFLSQALGLGADVTSRPITALGPQGESLYVDIALIGSRDPKKAVLHIAGVHGIEGFVGAAIQSEVMRAGPQPGEKTALVLVHCLNPHGMAHLRRVNADNVDLNRNFIPPGVRWGGTPQGYALLNALLNPQTNDFPWTFYPKIAWQIWKHGFDNLKDAVLRGQYDRPRGLFFGGTQREEETEILRGYVAQRLTRVEQVVGIDVHSGMGKYGQQTLFIDHMRQRARFSYLERVLGQELVPPPPDYHSPQKQTRGAVCDEVPRLFPNARVDWFLQEFGTFNPLTVLAALVEENRAYQYGAPGERTRNAEKFKNTFVPNDPRWREAIVRMGTKLVADTAIALAS